MSSKSVSVKKKFNSKIELCNYIRKSFIAETPNMPIKIGLIQERDGTGTPIQIDENGVCQKINKNDVHSAFHRFVMSEEYSDYVITNAMIKECARWWAMSGVSVPYPAHMLFKDQPGLCWHRLGFNVEEGPTPLFDEMMSRNNNAEALMAWTWSLLEPKSYRQQYVWLTGHRSGKSTFINFLEKIMGYAATLEETNAPGKGLHWSVPYVDKRLIIYPDFDSNQSLCTTAFTTLTGDDTIWVRPRYKYGFNYKPICKLIFGSNGMPAINKTRSHQRRIILCEMFPYTKNDPSYPNKLWSEAGAFLFKCKQVYERLCPNHDVIPCSQESLSSVSCWVDNLAYSKSY